MFVKKLVLKPKPPYNLEITAKNEIFSGVTSGIDRLSTGWLVKYITRQIGSIGNPKLEISVLSNVKPTEDELREIKEYLSDYYCVDEDLTDFYKLGEKDKILGFAQKDLRGARLLGGIESFFDCCVIVICSQNTSFKACRKMVDNLKQKFGEEFDSEYTFPIPDVIAKASIKDLLGCGLGYRAEYVKQFAKDFVEGKVDVEKLSHLDNDAARQELIKLKGVGPYSADVILLYGLGRRDVVYSDVLVRKAFSQLYISGEELTDEEFKKFAIKKWGRWAGLAEIYIIKDLENLSKRFGLSLKWI